MNLPAGFDNKQQQSHNLEKYVLLINLKNCLGETRHGENILNFTSFNINKENICKLDFVDNWIFPVSAGVQNRVQIR